MNEYVRKSFLLVWNSKFVFKMCRFFFGYSTSKMLRPWNPGRSSLKWTIPYTGYGFLLVFYSNFFPKMHRFGDIWLWKMSWPGNLGQRSLKVIRTDTDRSATYDFLLTLHNNYGPISYCFWDKRWFQSKIAKFSDPLCIFCIATEGFSSELGIGAWSRKTRMMGLPGWTRSLTISLAIWIQSTNMDGWTDTRRQQRPHLRIASCR